ncbi:MAG: NAD(P)H-hydrate dehydratase [Leptolyngbyaceae cyanobacterium]
MRHEIIVTAQQMQAIESAMFAAGLPIPALMEKVAGRIAHWLVRHFPREQVARVGFIVGPGHNGGDALVVARELFHHGYEVLIWQPLVKGKELTAQHQAYISYLGAVATVDSTALCECDLIVDGGFGVGLTRALSDEFAAGIDAINACDTPVVSIDLPSGLETDTGAVMGTVIRADHTLCLGLWKQGLLQDQAQPWIGQLHLIDFDIPAASLETVLSAAVTPRCITDTAAIARLPLPRSPVAHKYKVGHALLIVGSRQYGGAALLAGQGAIASGVGMLTLIVPESLRLTLLSHMPEALILGAEETATGAIATLPQTVALADYDVVACGPGLTLEAAPVIHQVLQSQRPAIFDADGLNIIAQDNPQALLRQRQGTTLLTPHPGEFRRLFPDHLSVAATPSVAASAAAQTTGCTIVLKGAMSTVAHADGQVWINAASSPALARGGSGDVLTGLVAGLAAQLCLPDPAADLLTAAIAAVWWHAQTGQHLANVATELGCPASQLAATLPFVLAQKLSQQ